MSLPFSGSWALKGAAPGLCVCVQGYVLQLSLSSMCLPVKQPGSGILCVRALLGMMAQKVDFVLLKWQ